MLHLWSKSLFTKKTNYNKKATNNLSCSSFPLRLFLIILLLYSHKCIYLFYSGLNTPLKGRSGVQLLQFNHVSEIKYTGQFLWKFLDNFNLLGYSPFQYQSDWSSVQFI